jgi:hypothetical protein
MSNPLVITIPHHLGRQEAARRLKSGLDTLVNSFGSALMMVDQNWASEDRLEFNLRALGQTTRGVAEVAEDNVRLEVELPWGLGALAEKVKDVIQKRAQLLLEKK